MPELTVQSRDGRLVLVNLLCDARLVSSASDGRRMIKQGAVRIDGERIEDATREISSGTSHVYQVGKRRFARVTLV